MRRFLDQLLRSRALVFVGLLVFFILWGLRASGVWGDGVAMGTLSAFGHTLSLTPWVAAVAEILLVLFNAFMIYVMANEYALYNSRAYFGVVLFLAVMGGPLFVVSTLSGLLGLAVFTLMLYVLWSTFQQRQAVSEYLLSFALIGAVTIVSPKWMLLVPFFFVGSTLLHSMSMRVFIASLLGFVTPYWIAAGILFLSDEMGNFLIPFQQLAALSPLGFGGVPAGGYVSLALVLFLSLPSLAVYPSSAYLVKERARVCYLYMMVVSVGVILMCLLQPLTMGEFLPMLLFMACIFVTQMLISSRDRFGSTYLLLFLILFGLYVTVPFWGSALIFD